MTSSTTTQELHDLTVAQLARHLRERKVSAVETAQHFLSRAQTHTSLGTFVDIDEGVTLAQARSADQRIASGAAAALEGVPIAHKDIFVTKDFCSTAGSKMLAGYRSPFDATVVAKLAAQGMVTLGKLNCDEFAMGSSNENSACGARGLFTAPSRRQSVGHQPHTRWVIRRQRSCGCSATHARGHRHRHRRLHSPASLVLRHHRHQAHLWARVALWHGGLCLQSGSGRTHGTHG